MEKDNLGKNIKAFRLQKGWTQQDLADKLGCTQKIITAYERSERFPPAGKIPLIASVLGVTVNELYGHSHTTKKEKIKNPKLWKKFEQLEQCTDHEKWAVFKMIDGILAQKKNKKNAP